MHILNHCALNASPWKMPLLIFISSVCIIPVVVFICFFVLHVFIISVRNCCVCVCWSYEVKNKIKVLLLTLYRPVAVRTYYALSPPAQPQIVRDTGSVSA